MIPAAKSNFAEFTFSACCNDYIRHKFLDLLSLVKVVETKFRGQRTPSPHSKSPLPSTSQREDVQYKLISNRISLFPFPLWPWNQTIRELLQSQRGGGWGGNYGIYENMENQIGQHLKWVILYLKPWRFLLFVYRAS